MSSTTTLVTKRKIHYLDAFLNPDFTILNMWTSGIWLVDMFHPNFEKALATAIDIAKSFGNKDAVDKYTAIQVPAVATVDYIYNSVTKESAGGK